MENRRTRYTQYNREEAAFGGKKNQRMIDARDGPALVRSWIVICQFKIDNVLQAKLGVPTAVEFDTEVVFLRTTLFLGHEDRESHSSNSQLKSYPNFFAPFGLELIIVLLQLAVPK